MWNRKASNTGGAGVTDAPIHANPTLSSQTPPPHPRKSHLRRKKNSAVAITASFPPPRSRRTSRASWPWIPTGIQILLLGILAIMIISSVWMVSYLEYTSSAEFNDQYSSFPTQNNYLRIPRPNHWYDSNATIDMRYLQARLPFDNPDGGAWKQGWDVHPTTRRPITVLVVPHSHNDPGWLKTFDDYFQSQTKHILTTVIDALLQNPKRTFIWAEISYFSWWWQEQSTERQEEVKQLLDQKQFEFVTGGWVMPDEANSELYAMEIQLQEGHEWIRTHIGEKYIPRYGWSIDPFGYSPTMPYLLHKYNFQGMLIQRVHYAIKKELARRKHLEFYWQQVWDKHHTHDIFTHVMPFYSYDVPHTCGPDPSVCCQFDFRRMRLGGNTTLVTCPWGKPPQPITSDNIQERSMLLLDQYLKKAELYRGNTVLVPLGDDFRWQHPQEAEAQYENYQRMMDYINQNVPEVTVRFGTLSEYFETVRNSFATPVLKGSFFTYSDVNQDYWSGYYTSRAFDKALDRRLERVLYAAESLGLTASELRVPRQALSLFQHHDGVTGTAKPHVVQDYAMRMYRAIEQAESLMLGQLMATNHGMKDDKMRPCWQSHGPRLLTENLCNPDKKVWAYNPLSFEQSCGSVSVPAKSTRTVMLPCDVHSSSTSVQLVFDDKTGLMLHPIKEEWKIWKVKAGGAYLFVPGTQLPYPIQVHQPIIEDNGRTLRTTRWSRTVQVKEIPRKYGMAIVLDFVYTTNLDRDNEEWFVRFSDEITNQGVFHTDLNGFNFDTHFFRQDLPVQSQVFPMPTMSSIQDNQRRLTVLSEHAQGTASLEEGSIDVWLDRRLRQDDNRGLAEGIRDNVPTRTRFRVVVEPSRMEKEFDITWLTHRMWEELQHPLQLFGTDLHGFSSAAPIDSLPGSAGVNLMHHNSSKHHQQPKIQRVVKTKDH